MMGGEGGGGLAHSLASGWPGASDANMLTRKVHPAHSLPVLSQLSLGVTKKLFHSLGLVSLETYPKESVQINLGMLKSAEFSLDLLFRENDNKPLYLFVKQRDSGVYYFIEVTENTGKYNLVKFNGRGKRTDYGEVVIVIDNLDGDYRGYITLPEGKGQIKTGVIE